MMTVPLPLSVPPLQLNVPVGGLTLPWTIKPLARLFVSVPADRLSVAFGLIVNVAPLFRAPPLIVSAPVEATLELPVTANAPLELIVTVELLLMLTVTALAILVLTIRPPPKPLTFAMSPAAAPGAAGSPG